MARLREAEGDLDGALDLLDEAERVYVGDFFPNVRPVPAVRARLLAAQGGPGRGPRLGPRAGPVRRRRPVLPARVRAHHPGQGAPGAARDRAFRALPARRGQPPGAPARGRGGRGPDGSVIEILVLQALAHQARGDIPAALCLRGTRADPGRAGGLRPGVRRRGPADGCPAQGGREAADRARLRRAGCSAPSTADRARPPRQPGPGRPAERTRARRAAAARPATWTARPSPASSWCP